MTESPAGHPEPGAPGAAAPGRDLRFALLAAAVGLEAAGIGVLFPLLAHLQRIHHLPTYSLGLMSGASFFAALFAQLGAGPFLDRAGGQRLLLGGLVLGAAGLVWFAFAGNLTQLVVARALGGVGYGIVQPAALRQASVGVTGARRGQRIGVLSSAQMVGISMGPLFGSVLYTLGGIRLPFEVVAAGIIAVGAGVVAAPKPRPARSAPASPSPAAGATALATAGAGNGRRHIGGVPVSGIVLVALLGAAMQLPYGLYDALWSRLLTDRGASALLIGLSLTVFGVPFILLAPIGGRLAERRGPLIAAAIGLVLSDCFMASYGFVRSPEVIIALGVGEACVAAVATPAGFAAVNRVFPDQRIATGQGIYGGSGTIAAGTSAMVGAPVFAALGAGAAFAGGATASAALVVVAVLVGLSRRGQPSAEQQVSTMSRVTT